MIMTAEFTTGSYDCDFNGNMSVSSVMRYLQEAANLEHEKYGPTIGEIRRGGHALILTRAALDVYVPLGAPRRLTVRTWLASSGGFVFDRNTVMYESGKKVAAMKTVWGVIDTDTRRLARVDTVPLGFGTDEESLELSAPLRARPGKDAVFSELGKHRVVYSDCDENMHMNNTVYPAMFLGYLDPRAMLGRYVSSMTVNYQNEAPVGSTFTVLCAEEGGSCWFRSIREDGSTGTEARMVFSDLPVK